MDLNGLPAGVYQDWVDLLNKPDDQVRLSVLIYDDKNSNEDLITATTVAATTNETSVMSAQDLLSDRAALDPSFGAYGAHPTAPGDPLGAWTVRSREAEDLMVVILLGSLSSGLVSICIYNVILLAFVCVFSRRLGRFLFWCAVLALERFNEVDAWMQVQGIDHPWKHVYLEQREAWKSKWPVEADKEDEETQEEEEGKTEAEKAEEGKKKTEAVAAVQAPPRGAIKKKQEHNPTIKKVDTNFGSRPKRGGGGGGVSLPAAKVTGIVPPEGRGGGRGAPPGVRGAGVPPTRGSVPVRALSTSGMFGGRLRRGGWSSANRMRLQPPRGGRAAPGARGRGIRRV